MLDDNPVFIAVGEEGRHELPHSEVCMHMRVAGISMRFRVIDGGSTPMVQLLNEDGTPHSGAITCGEAGVFTDGQGRMYYYPDVPGTETRPKPEPPRVYHLVVKGGQELANATMVEALNSHRLHSELVTAQHSHGQTYLTIHVFEGEARASYRTVHAALSDWMAKDMHAEVFPDGSLLTWSSKEEQPEEAST